MEKNATAAPAKIYDSYSHPRGGIPTKKVLKKTIVGFAAAPRKFVHRVMSHPVYLHIFIDVTLLACIC